MGICLSAAEEAASPQVYFASVRFLVHAIVTSMSMRAKRVSTSLADKMSNERRLRCFVRRLVSRTIRPCRELVCHVAMPAPNPRRCPRTFADVRHVKSTRGSRCCELEELPLNCGRSGRYQPVRPRFEQKLRLSFSLWFRHQKSLALADHSAIAANNSRRNGSRSERPFRISSGCTPEWQVRHRTAHTTGTPPVSPLPVWPAAIRRRPHRSALPRHGAGRQSSGRRVFCRTALGTRWTAQSNHMARTVAVFPRACATPIGL